MGPVWDDCVRYARGESGTDVERLIREQRERKARKLAAVIDEMLDDVCSQAGADRRALDIKAVVLSLPLGARRDAERKARVRKSSNDTWAIVADELARQQEAEQAVLQAVESLLSLARRAIAH